MNLRNRYFDFQHDFDPSDFIQDGVVNLHELGLFLEDATREIANDMTVQIYALVKDRDYQTERHNNPDISDYRECHQHYDPAPLVFADITEEKFKDCEAA